MGVALTQYESGAPFAGDAAAALASLQERLAQLHLAQIVHGGRAIILFEGWDGAGKRQALKAFAGALDPCHFAVHCVDGGEMERGRHWLAPYWSRLPGNGQTAIFFPGWYRDAAATRSRGEVADKAWARTCDEINEFEAQQTDHGTIVVKLFFHLTEAVQAERLRARRSDPWLRALDVHEEAAPRDALLRSWSEMFDRTDTRWARWTIVDAGNAEAARIAALEAVAAALAKRVPAEPPKASANVVALSTERYG